MSIVYVVYVFLGTCIPHNTLRYKKSDFARFGKHYLTIFQKYIEILCIFQIILKQYPQRHLRRRPRALPRPGKGYVFNIIWQITNTFQILCIVQIMFQKNKNLPRAPPKVALGICFSNLFGKYTIFQITFENVSNNVSRISPNRIVSTSRYYEGCKFPKIHKTTWTIDIKLTIHHMSFLRVDIHLSGRSYFLEAWHTFIGSFLFF